MNTTNGQAATPINEFDSRPVGETTVPRTQDLNSAVVGEVVKPLASAAPAPAVHGVLERRFKRRNNINGLAGLIREHARLIALMRNNEIALDRGEVLSRAMARHKEMVVSLEQSEQLKDIQSQLAALRGESTPLLPTMDRDDLDAAPDGHGDEVQS
ncbi:MAG: hypothetical protein ABSH33_18645 [Steroidobacteraceae bacterium]|jgi:hypothetical protein